MARTIAVADCETDPFKKGRTDIKPFIWGFYDGIIYKEFTRTIDFINYVKELDIILYAHNGGKFDWFFILEYLEEFSELMIINGRLSKFTIGNCEFRDSYNILPIPLAAYKKDDIDYAIFEKEERDKTKNKILISDYLRSDCIYLYQLAAHFIENYGNGLTLAGSAFKFWQKLCDEKAPRTSKYFYDQFKPFYYGGRVEVFESGIIRRLFKVVDINSAYPNAMLSLHPYGDRFNISKELPKSTPHIQRAFITIKCVSRGAFPFREKSGLTFPNDGLTRVYKITGWEYLAAVKNDAISNVEIIEVCTFSETIEFSEYVKHFYNLKENSERGTPAYISAKNMLVSLYGKFGSNPDEYMEYTISEPKHILASACDGFTYASTLGEWALLQKPLSEEKQHYFNVAVAASITGFVRAQLFEAISQCGGVIYCDTDSIAATDIGELELSPTKLGAWDLEAECNFAAVAGKKLYYFHKTDGGYKKASKGARLTGRQILKVAVDAPQLYEPIAPSFSLKRGIKITNRLISKKSEKSLLFIKHRVKLKCGKNSHKLKLTF